MTAQNPVVITLSALAAGALAFAAARSLDWTSATASRESSTSATTASSAAQKSASALRHISLPEAAFTDEEGFSAYVESLQKLGLGEGMAKWLAISAKTRQDPAASLELAQKLGLESQWACAAALTDPAGTLPLVRSLPGEHSSAIYEQSPYGYPMARIFVGSESTSALNAFFQTLGRTNPKAGLELLLQLPSREAAMASGALFGTWAAMDPEAVLQAIDRLPAGNLRRSATGSLFGEWSKENPREMMEWAAGKDLSTAKDAFRSLSSRDDGDPTVVLEMARDFPKAVDSFALVNVANNLARKKPEDYQMIMAYPAGQARDTMIGEYWATKAQADPKGAWEQIKSLSPEEQNTIFRSYSAMTFVSIAPAEVAKMALEHRTGEITTDRVIEQWAQKDPRAATEWAAQNLDGQELSEAIGSSIRQWAKNDPASAIAAANQLPIGLRARTLPNLIGVWAETNPQAALAYVSTLPPIDQQRSTGRLLETWASQDPAAAAAMIVKFSYDNIKDTYFSVGWYYAQKNPVEAWSWAQSLTDTAMGARVARPVACSWVQQDAATASERVAALPAGNFRDQAVAGFSAGLAALDPTQATGWAETIGNDKTRTDAIRDIITGWRHSNRDQARAYVTAMKPGSFKDEMQRFVEK